MKFDYIASGHYADVTHSSFDQKNVPSILSLSKDMVPKLYTFLLSLSFSPQVVGSFVSVFLSLRYKHIILISDYMMMPYLGFS